MNQNIDPTPKLEFFAGLDGLRMTKGPAKAEIYGAARVMEADRDNPPLGRAMRMWLLEWCTLNGRKDPFRKPGQ
jgi:hypothetical protein